MDDWRIEVDLPDAHEHSALIEHFLMSDSEMVEEEFEDSFDEQLVVTRDGSTVFIYPHDAEQARRAEAAVRAVVSEKGLTAKVSVTRWHDAEETWEPATVPLPQTPAQTTAEHEHLIQSERDQTAKQGRFAFDVLVTLEHHSQAAALAERLEREGMPVSRRWRYLVVGAADEDEAARLEAQIKSESPAGATVATFTRENLRDTVEYVDELGAESAFTVPGLPGIPR